MEESLRVENPSAHRHLYLDALRGFDMLWIIGGEEVIHAGASWTGWSWLRYLSNQFQHVSWDGFKFYDFIFPLFLFIAGVTIPLMFQKRLERGENKRALYWRVLRRGLVLVILGIIYNNGVTFDIENMRLPSVLGRIGLAYTFAALIALNFSPRGQAIWTGGLLLSYFAAMKLIPVPGFGPGVLSLQGNLASYIDRLTIPGQLYVNDIHDPEGLFSTLPAIATALMGALAGSWMLSKTSPKVKSLGLLIAGLVGLVIGLLWHPVFPINKNLWSSSFAVFAAGWSLLFLLAFYLVIEVLGWQRWALPFIVIGSNAILVYFLSHTGLLNFGYIADFFFGFLWRSRPEALRDMLSALATIGVELVFLWVLYRKKVFFRV